MNLTFQPFGNGKAEPICEDKTDWFCRLVMKQRITDNPKHYRQGKFVFSDPSRVRIKQVETDIFSDYIRNF